MPEPSLPVYPYDGYWAVWLGGANDEVAYIEQDIYVPVDKPILYFWARIVSDEIGCSPDYDMAGVYINELLVIPYLLCDTAEYGWFLNYVDLSAEAGHFVTLRFAFVSDSSRLSNFFLDALSFHAYRPFGDNDEAGASGADGEQPTPREKEADGIKRRGPFTREAR